MRLDLVDPIGIEGQVILDLRDSGARNALLAQAARNDHMQAVSALTGDGLNELFGLLDRYMTADRVTVDLCVRIEVGAALAHGEQRLVAVDGDGDGEALPLEVVGEELADRLLILDHEHPCGHPAFPARQRPWNGL